MAIELEVLTEAEFDDWAGSIAETDGTRSSFTVEEENRLLLISANLAVQAEWPVDDLPRHTGNAAHPRTGRALICDRRHDEVRLIDQRGRVLWRHEHAPWAGAIESGCAWFDQAGDPYAVVPDLSREGCRILRFDAESGQVKADSFIRAAPVGIVPLHHPDGWTGLTVGEGQDGSLAWWVRPRPGPSPEFDVLEAGWSNWSLSDVDSSGTKIITTPHEEGPLQVRSFPGLEVLREVESPNGDGENWPTQACFADDLIVTMFDDKYADEYEDVLTAIEPNGTLHEIRGAEDGILLPAADGTLLMSRGNRIRRCRPVRR